MMEDGGLETVDYERGVPGVWDIGLTVTTSTIFICMPQFLQSSIGFICFFYCTLLDRFQVSIEESV